MALPQQRTAPPTTSSPPPTPGLRAILLDPDLSSQAKVVYTLLDDMGRGRPVAIRQEEIAHLLGVTRRTVALALRSLRDRKHVMVTAYSGPEGSRMLAYRTRTSTADRSEEIIFY